MLSRSTGRVRTGAAATLAALASLGALVARGRSARAQDWVTPPEPSPTSTAEPVEPVAEVAAPAGGRGPPLDVELAGVASYLSPPIRGGTNPFGFGFGGRIGLVYSGFYLGLSVIDYLGGSDFGVSYQSLLYGVEVGYGVRFPVLGSAALTLRPLLGLGDAAVSYTDPALAADVVTSASGSSGSSSDTITVNSVYLEPATLLMLSSGSHFAAARASALVIPAIQSGGAEAATWLSYGARLELGFVF